jgi:hypothetical protein
MALEQTFFFFHELFLFHSPPQLVGRWDHNALWTPTSSYW